ncbi:MAG: exonuclease subunit SbcD [bacterium]|nr:exonuclease subunit SbcD [bacterium]
MSFNFIHLSDLHLGKKIKSLKGDIDRYDEFYNTFKEIEYIIKQSKCEFIIVSGDIFHNKLPSLEAEELFINFLINIYELVNYIFIISGNHDSDLKLKNLNTYNKILNKFSNKKIIIYTFIDLEEYFNNNSNAPYFEFKINDNNVLIILVPFIEYRLGLKFHQIFDIEKEYSYSKLHSILLNKILQEKILNKNTLKILVMHVMLDEVNLGSSESPLCTNDIYKVLSNDIVFDFNYIALGHIHRYQKINNIHYSGSILPLDFGEDYPHGIILNKVDHNLITSEFIELKSHKRLITLDLKKTENINNLIKQIEDNKNSYIKIKIYDNSESIDIQKLINFENVIKIEKFIKEDKNLSNQTYELENQINTLDFSNVLQVYEMYYKELKISKNEKDLEKIKPKLKKILNKLEELINKEI